MITLFQISKLQESPAFNGRRSFLTLRVAGCSPPLSGIWMIWNTHISVVCTSMQTSPRSRCGQVGSFRADTGVSERGGAAGVPRTEFRGRGERSAAAPSRLDLGCQAFRKG